MGHVAIRVSTVLNIDHWDAYIIQERHVIECARIWVRRTMISF